jgi:allantoinase
MSQNVADFLNISHKKGQLKEGMDADIMIWSPEVSFIVDQSQMQFRHKITPYDKERLYGKVNTTIVNGEIVFDQGSFVSLCVGKKIFNAFRSSHY